MKWIGLGLVDRDVEEFFINLTKQTLELREKNNIVRKYFFQLLVQLRNNGNVQLDDEWQTIIENNSSKTLTLNELAAHAFIFYVAGTAKNQFNTCTKNAHNFVAQIFRRFFFFLFKNQGFE